MSVELAQSAERALVLAPFYCLYYTSDHPEKVVCVDWSPSLGPANGCAVEAHLAARPGAAFEGGHAPPVFRLSAGMDLPRLGRHPG